MIREMYYRPVLALSMMSAEACWSFESLVGSCDDPEQELARLEDEFATIEELEDYLLGLY